VYTQNPITAMGIHHVTARTKALEVATTAPLHLVWPYVRADSMVPDGMRAVSTVFTKKLSTEDFEEVEAALIEDVGWRWDKGYVVAAKYTEGWVFAWSEGERDG